MTKKLEDILNLPNVKKTFEEVDKKEKERLIKRNDSLFAILNQLGVPKKDIINLINSKKSSLLSKIEVGDKIRIFVDRDGFLHKLFYVDDFDK